MLRKRGTAIFALLGEHRTPFAFFLCSTLRDLHAGAIPATRFANFHEDMIFLNFWPPKPITDVSFPANGVEVKL